MQKRLGGGWLLQVVVVVVKYKLKRLRPEKNIKTLVAAQNSEAFFFLSKDVVLLVLLSFPLHVPPSPEDFFTLQSDHDPHFSKKSGDSGDHVHVKPVPPG